MNSYVSVSRWLLVGILSVTTLLGCQSDVDKAHDQANKANAYINEQNSLRQDLQSDYGITVAKTGILTQEELYINIEGQDVGYFPACIQDGTRDDIKNKLTRVVVLSEEIQKIMTNEDVKYNGPASDFEHVKQNAQLMLTELDNNPDCSATTVSGAPKNEESKGDVEDPTEETTFTPQDVENPNQQKVNELVNEVQQSRDVLEADYGIVIPVDEKWTYRQFRDSDVMPECWESQDQRKEVLKLLTSIFAATSRIRGKVKTTDAEYGGGEEELKIMINNVGLMMRNTSSTRACR